MAKAIVLGTIQGKLKVLVKEEDCNMHIPGCWVKSPGSATYTDARGKFSISDTPGKKQIDFIYEKKVGKEPTLLGSISVDFVADTITEIDAVVLDPDHAISEEAKKCLKKIIKDGWDDDPNLPGYFTGYVQDYNHHAIKIPGARIWTSKNYNDTYSDASGLYFLSRPADTYVLYASHDPDYNNLNPPANITVVPGVTKTKNINLVKI
jgi:hypothetical protein